MNSTRPSNSLSKTLINEIGNYLGLEMEDTDTDRYCTADCTYWKGYWLLNFRIMDLRITTYTLNLTTGKPTKNSPIQSQISPELKEKIREELKHMVPDVFGYL